MRKILVGLKTSVPAELEKELLEEYTGHITDDEGHEIQYTGQDVYEQLRKRPRQYEKTKTASNFL